MGKKTLWQVFSAMPHRMFFALGTVLLVLPMLWWTHYLYERYFGELYQLSHPPIHAHVMLMVYGALSQFVLGFALTVFPRWLSTQDIRPISFKVLFLLNLAGFLIYSAGLWLGGWIPAIGSGLVYLSFSTATIILLKVLLNSQHPDKTQVWYTWVAFASASAGTLFFTVYLVLDEAVYYRLATGIGVYFFLPLLVLSIAYRMVPFFTSVVLEGYQVRRVKWVLRLWLLACLLKTILFVLGLKEFYFVSELGLLTGCLVQFYYWDFFRKKKVWLLKYLYISLAWLPISSLLFALFSLDAFFTGIQSYPLELASTHALLVGCISSLVFGMATRVSLGHSGRPLTTGKFEDLLFLLLQLTAFIRVGGELLRIYDPLWESYIGLSGVLWLVCFIVWGIKYFPIYFLPRIDGNPG